jgi:hypothetical protein
VATTLALGIMRTARPRAATREAAMAAFARSLAAGIGRVLINADRSRLCAYAAFMAWRRITVCPKNRTHRYRFTGARPHRRCWPSRPDLGERWPARLVATAAEDRLRFRANPHTSFAGSTRPRQVEGSRVSPVQGFRLGWHDFSFSRGCVPLPLNLTGGSGCADFGRDLTKSRPIFCSSAFGC